MKQVFNVYKFFCKECGWMGDELEKSGCVTYGDTWYVCPKCSRDASETIAQNAAIKSAYINDSNEKDEMNGSPER